MTADDVRGSLTLMADHGIRVWLDGGWGVDACLGTQTRNHGDLDIVIEERHLSAARRALEARGYVPVPRDDTCPWNFVLGDEAGHEIDFHVITLNEEGDGIYGPGGDVYPAEAMTGTGSIGDRHVSCISPEWLVRFHVGYAIDEYDFADVSALCARFQIPLPDAYRAFPVP
jgi:lincosamide nucleotidyltransferase A/C/D/E